MEPATYKYYIYAVDINEKVDRSDPVFRLSDEFPFDMALAVVNSTLYMFGGVISSWRKKSYSYCLSPKSNTCDVQFKDVNPISKMQRGKIMPQAVFISDQICVFSSHLDDKGSNFELYDPDTNDWHSLPDPPIDFANVPRSRIEPRGIKYCIIEFYCVENLVLFISTAVGSYCIDFGQPRDDRTWVLCNKPMLPFPKESESSQLFLKAGDFMLTRSFNVYSLKNATNSQQQPLLSFSYMGNQALQPRHRSIFLLPKKGTEERLRACIFETGGPKGGDPDYPKDAMFWFYLFEFDDGNYNDTKKLGTTVLNSGLFRVDKSIRTYDIHIIGVFPV